MQKREKGEDEVGRWGRRHVVPLGTLALGLAACVALVWGVGLGDLERALAPVRGGFVPIVLAHVLPLLCDMMGWRLLFMSGAPPVPALAGIRLIGEACNNLLPVAQIGGEFVRARVAVIAGADAIDAAATVVADITVGAATQIVFCLVAVLLVMVLHDSRLAVPVLLSLLTLAAAVAAFLLLQRRSSLAFVERCLGRFLSDSAWFSRLGRIAVVHEKLETIYGDRRRVVRAGVWRLVGWFAGSVEMYLTLLFLGHPVGWAEAVILEALPQAARSAAFAVPGGLGVQEAGFMAIGAMLGLDPATGLAVGLIRRGRDVVLGTPALAAYGVIEARRRSALRRTT